MLILILLLHAFTVLGEANSCLDLDYTIHHRCRLGTCVAGIFVQISGTELQFFKCHLAFN